MAAWRPNAVLVQTVSVSPLAQQVLDAHFLEGGCRKESSSTFARRCRSSGGKYLRASSGTVERSLFSLLVTRPSP